VRAARVGGYAAVGFAVGVAAGVLVWSSQMRRFRQDLFNPSPMRRLAALGYLRGSDASASARVLRDYVRWERSPSLRKRGERLLRRLERNIGSHGGREWHRG
jgi:hypothetical protein